MVYDAIVIGGGISGLTAAYRLKRAGQNVLLLEANRAGGKIASERLQGFLIETGPNSLRVDNQETLDLIHSLGLGSEVVQANTIAKDRFILKHGKWVKLPSNPLQAVSTPLISAAAKFRLLREPWISKSVGEDESVAEFFSRRFGREALEYGVDPFISGIYAGDPAKLSIKHAFGSLWELEQKYGSVIGGIVKKPKSKTPRIKSQIISFERGLQQLIDALVNSIGDSMHSESSVLEIDRSDNNYSVRTSAGERMARTLILATPAYAAAKLIQNINQRASDALSRVHYPPIVIAQLGYSANQFAKPPEGFGGLIPSSERRPVLGVIYSSSTFPNRAPSGSLLLTVMMGGARNEDVVTWNEERILATAIAEIEKLYAVTGSPTLAHTERWEQAIPQYEVGYDAVLTSLQDVERENPGLHFLGNYRGGVSIGACIRNATQLANALVLPDRSII